MVSKYRTGSGYRPHPVEFPFEGWEGMAVAMFIVAALTMLLGFSCVRDEAGLAKTRVSTVAAPVGSTQV